jgi:hypothetical protein
MAKINLGRKLDFGKPIDLGDALYEQSLKNVQLVNKIIIPPTKGRMMNSQSSTTPVTLKPLKKKIDLGKELDFGKKVDFGKELCL